MLLDVTKTKGEEREMHRECKSHPWHAECEDLALLTLITLAPKQQKQSNNKVDTGVTEREMSS